MQTQGKDRAFTVLELLILVVVVFVLGGLFLTVPCPGRSRQKAVRINCVNNLKQVGLAFRLWQDDHNNMYPMQSLTNGTGLSLYADAANGFRYFQAMSNELATPKILVCPADKRVPATNFTTDFSGAHLSYFVGLDADVTRSGAFLGGDRTLRTGKRPATEFWRREQIRILVGPANSIMKRETFYLRTAACNS